MRIPLYLYLQKGMFFQGGHQEMVLQPLRFTGRTLAVNLVLYRMVRPKAYIDEVQAYIHNCNPVNLPYSQSQIYRAEL